MSNKPFRFNTKALALLLCAGVLLSSVSVTFAWFGSTFENLNTEIRMGEFTADITVYDAAGAKVANQTAKNGETVSFDSTSKIGGWSSGDVSAYYIYVDNSGEIDLKSYLSFTSEFTSPTVMFPENKEHFAFYLKDITKEAEQANGVVNYMTSAKLPTAEEIYNNGSTFGSTDSAFAGELESGKNATYVLYYCCYDIPDEFVSNNYKFTFNTEIVTTQAGAPDNAKIPSDEELNEIAENLASGVVDETTVPATTVPTTQQTTDSATKPEDSNVQISDNSEWVWKYNDSKNKTATILEYNGTSENVTIPSLANNAVVTSLGSELLKNTEVKSVVVPATVSHFANDTFTSENLRNIKFQKKTEANGKVYTATYTSDNKAIFSADKTSLVRYLPQNTSTVYTVPYEVKAIFDYAFNGCDKLEVLSMKNVNVVTAKTFKGCNIKTFRIYGNEAITAVGNNVFGNKKTTAIHVLDDMADVFTNCSAFNGYKVNADLAVDIYERIYATTYNGLDYMILKNGGEYNGVKFNSAVYSEFVIVTGYKAIPKNGVLVIPETIISDDKVYNVVAIADGALENCKGLKTLNLPSLDMSFTSKAFEGCKSLKQIVYGDMEKDDTVVVETTPNTTSAEATTEPKVVESTVVVTEANTTETADITE